MSRTIHAVHVKKRPVNEGHRLVLDAIAPYARRGEPADYDKIAAELGRAPSTISVLVMQLLQAGVLVRLGTQFSRRFRIVGADAAAIPTIGSAPFIRPPSRAQLMGRRA